MYRRQLHLPTAAACRCRSAAATQNSTHASAEIAGGHAAGKLPWQACKHTCLRTPWPFHAASIAAKPYSYACSPSRYSCCAAAILSYLPSFCLVSVVSKQVCQAHKQAICTDCNDHVLILIKPWTASAGGLGCHAGTQHWRDSDCTALCRTLNARARSAFRHQAQLACSNARMSGKFAMA